MRSSPWLFLFLFIFCLRLTSTSITSPIAHEYRLRLFDIRNGKRLDIVYRRDDLYLPDALAQLDDYLRDRRTGDIRHYDPRVFDLLYDLETALKRPGSEIDVLCGYRSPRTNQLLRRRRDGVALHSLHMKGLAIDIRMPDVKTTALRDAALALHRGGVGFYPASSFVHVDVGRVRRWSWGTTNLLR